MLYESVPNFSEGRRRDVIDAIAGAAEPAFLLDADPDPDHNRVVVSLAGSKAPLVEGLLNAIRAGIERIDLREHHGVHPRVGAADVVPIVPLGDASLESARAIAHDIGHRIWTELKVPVFFYGHAEHRSLADIRAGRVKPDLGGLGLHPAAGAVCVGARAALIAFNVILYDTDLVSARALARSIRESGNGLRGVQALAFELPGRQVQLSMNLFRVDETSPADVIAELERRGVEAGATQLVGLCPAVVATAVADGRLLEARLASSAAGEGARRCAARGGEEHVALARRLTQEAGELSQLAADQDAILAGSERAAALIHVLRAAQVSDSQLEEMLIVAARGFRRAISPATEAIYRDRMNALDARLV